MAGGLNLSGQQFGELTVVNRMDGGQHGQPSWRCHCACGNWLTVSTAELLNGQRQDCGDSVHGKSQRRRQLARRQDVTGQRFGRLVALRPVSRRVSNGDTMWLCQCDCGNQAVVDVQRLKAGTSRSCGCLRREASRQRMTADPRLLVHVGDDTWLPHRALPTAATKLRRRNGLGVLGVRFDPVAKVWNARLMHHGVYVLNRSFQRFDEAVAARRAAEQLYLPAAYASLAPAEQ